MWDVAVIGAGLSGIICARRLVSAGYSVCIVDKSRGLGGRMATRRVSGQSDGQVRVDHGLRYWQPKSEGLQTLTNELVAAGILQQWAASEYEIQVRGELTSVATEPAAKYAANAGMSAIAKYWLQQPNEQGLPAFEPEQNLLTNHRVTAISPRSGHWIMQCETGAVIKAKRCAIAIPAEQAATLLENGLTTDQLENGLSGPSHNGATHHREAPPSQSADQRLQTSIESLKAVRYFPCLTVMAGYGQACSNNMGELDPEGWMVTDRVGTSTDWVGLDSSKRDRAAAPANNHSSNATTGPVIVIHSKPDFAQRYLDASDLQPAASVLLRANARKLADWIAQPNWFQIQRWRYAQVKTPHPESALAITDTLICGGDWCIDAEAPDNLSNIDYAYLSGMAMASHLLQASPTSSPVA